jgi:hypothetical protein
MFATEKIAGVEYMRADKRLIFWDEDYMKYYPLAVSGIFIYPLGIPLLYFIFLYKNRHTFHTEATAYRFGFLYDQYEHEKYYYEIIELFRKLTLTGTVIFYEDGTISQIALALLISCLFLMLHIGLQAYEYDDDDNLQMCAMSAATATLFAGILIRAQDQASDPASSLCSGGNVQNPTTFGKDFMGILLVFIQVSVIVVSLYVCLGKKLYPQLVEFSYRMKKMQATLKKMDAARKTPGHMLEEAAKLQLEEELQLEYEIRFENDDDADIDLITPILENLRAYHESMGTIPGSPTLSHGGSPISNKSHTTLLRGRTRVINTDENWNSQEVVMHHLKKLQMEAVSLNDHGDQESNGTSDTNGTNGTLRMSLDLSTEVSSGLAASLVDRTFGVAQPMSTAPTMMLIEDSEVEDVPVASSVNVEVPDDPITVSDVNVSRTSSQAQI